MTSQRALNSVDYKFCYVLYVVLNEMSSLSVDEIAEARARTQRGGRNEETVSFSIIGFITDDSDIRGISVAVGHHISAPELEVRTADFAFCCLFRSRMVNTLCISIKCVGIHLCKNLFFVSRSYN